MPKIFPNYGTCRAWLVCILHILGVHVHNDRHIVLFVVSNVSLCVVIV